MAVFFDTFTSLVKLDFPILLLSSELFATSDAWLFKKKNIVRPERPKGATKNEKPSPPSKSSPPSDSSPPSKSSQSSDSSPSSKRAEDPDRSGNGKIPHPNKARNGNI